MPVRFNTDDLNAISFNNDDLDFVYFNGDLVFSKNPTHGHCTVSNPSSDIVIHPDGMSIGVDVETTVVHGHTLNRDFKFYMHDGTTGGWSTGIIVFDFEASVAQSGGWSTVLVGAGEFGFLVDGNGDIYAKAANQSGTSLASVDSCGLSGLATHTAGGRTISLETDGNGNFRVSYEANGTKVATKWFLIVEQLYPGAGVPYGMTNPAQEIQYTSAGVGVGMRGLQSATGGVYDLINFYGRNANVGSGTWATTSVVVSADGNSMSGESIAIVEGVGYGMRLVNGVLRAEARHVLGSGGVTISAGKFSGSTEVTDSNNYILRYQADASGGLETLFWDGFSWVNLGAKYFSQ